jgi:hypothetical protein
VFDFGDSGRSSWFTLGSLGGLLGLFSEIWEVYFGGSGKSSLFMLGSL